MYSGLVRFRPILAAVTIVATVVVFVSTAWAATTEGEQP